MHMHFFCSISGPDLANCLQGKQRRHRRRNRGAGAAEEEPGVIGGWGGCLALARQSNFFVSEQFMLPARTPRGQLSDSEPELHSDPSPAGNLLLVAGSLKVERSSNCLPGIFSAALFLSYLICDWAEWANKLVAPWTPLGMQRHGWKVNALNGFEWRKFKYYVLMVLRLKLSVDWLRFAFEFDLIKVVREQKHKCLKVNIVQSISVQK